MRNKPRLWALWKQSQEWTTRPSEILFIEEPYLAYCLDEAVYWFGSEVESEIEKAGKSKSKNDTEEKKALRMKNKLRECLGIEKQFADPSNLMK